MHIPIEPLQSISTLKRRILFLFAMLDAWIVLRHGFGSLRQAARALGSMSELPAIVPVTETLRLLLLLALVAPLAARFRRPGNVRRLSAACLPLRLYFAVLGEPQYLSLAFLRPAALAWIPGPPNPIAVLGTLAGIEILRTLLTLWPLSRRD